MISRIRSLTGIMPGFILFFRSDLTFNPIGRCTLMFTIVRSGDGEVFGIDIPRTLDIYPVVFPINIDDPGYNRAKGEFRYVKLTFARLLQIPPSNKNPFDVVG